MDQAIIIIHGIGEQKPMDTVRSFVEAVLPEPESGEKYLSKPDRMSEIFELRKLQNRTRPRTHFFEYYWAYQMEGTKLQHVWKWTFSLLFRLPTKVPKHLIPLWLITWFLAIIVVFFTYTGVFKPYTSLPGDLLNQTSSFSIASFGALFLSIIQYFIVHYIGDAARYLSPNPKNIAVRQKIRSQGINLVRQIQQSGDYNRIVLVGHSLGSVIAYDILKNLWIDYNTEYKKPKKIKQEALKSVEGAGEALRKSTPDEDTIKDFQQLQNKLWHEQYSLGNEWLVTDLITLGSPLAHAAILLAHDNQDLAARQRQRELPTCPPIPEIKKTKRKEDRKYSFTRWEKFEANSKKFNLNVLHHAALFACTRWTNLYFKTYLGLFGDIVGGPLAKVFGPGILDKSVKSRKWFGLVRFTPFCHTRYWWKKKSLKEPTDIKSTNSLDVLRNTLDVKGERSFPESVPS